MSAEAGLFRTVGFGWLVSNLHRAVYVVAIVCVCVCVYV
jgi:hypothetical protein